MRTTEIRIWHPPGQAPRTRTLELVWRARMGAGPAALMGWRAAWPGCQVAYVHGARHDLWWEFTLADSLRWQRQACRLTGEYWRRREEAILAALGLVPLLARTPEEMTPRERSLADLAVALLPAPEVLLWEEPFHQLTEQDRAAVIRLVRGLNRSEGLAVVAAASAADSLAALDGEAVPVAPLGSHPRGERRTRGVGRLAAAQ